MSHGKQRTLSDFGERNMVISPSEHVKIILSSADISTDTISFLCSLGNDFNFTSFFASLSFYRAISVTNKGCLNVWLCSRNTKSWSKNKISAILVTAYSIDFSYSAMHNGPDCNDVLPFEKYYKF